jgi:hypothetical protein
MFQPRYVPNDASRKTTGTPPSSLPSASIRSGDGTLARTVAVTFTEKAAGEMKLRLRLEIEKARADATQEERERLDRALEELELARIGTIHAFCGDLLSERPVEAGVDPVFKMVAEDEAEALADEAFERWLERILANPPEGPRRILRRRSGLDHRMSSCEPPCMRCATTSRRWGFIKRQLAQRQIRPPGASCSWSRHLNV